MEDKTETVETQPVQRAKQYECKLDDFDLLEVLGKGSYGIVHKVRKKETDEVFVLKKISLKLLSEENRINATKEVKILKNLHHENIIKYHSSFREGDAIYILMDYAEGGDLHKYIKDRLPEDPFSEEEIWDIATQLCNGVQYLHKTKIIHRDLKTLNIFLTKDKKIKIGDLGVSVSVANMLSMQMTRVGTPLYLAPELVKQLPYDFKVDIWAVGCILYQLATGETPFSGDNLITLGHNIVFKKPKPLGGKFSPRFTTFINRLLEKNPKERPSITRLISYIPEIYKKKPKKEKSRSSISKLHAGITTLPDGSSDVKSMSPLRRSGHSRSPELKSGRKASYGALMGGAEEENLPKNLPRHSALDSGRTNDHNQTRSKSPKRPSTIMAKKNRGSTIDPEDLPSRFSPSRNNSDHSFQIQPVGSRQASKGNLAFGDDSNTHGNKFHPELVLQNLHNRHYFPQARNLRSEEKALKVLNPKLCSNSHSSSTEKLIVREIGSHIRGTSTIVRSERDENFPSANKAPHTKLQPLRSSGEPLLTEDKERRDSSPQGESIWTEQSRIRRLTQDDSPACRKHSISYLSQSGNPFTGFSQHSATIRRSFGSKRPSANHKIALGDHLNSMNRSRIQEIRKTIGTFIPSVLTDVPNTLSTLTESPSKHTNNDNQTSSQKYILATKKRTESILASRKGGFENGAGRSFKMESFDLNLKKKSGVGVSFKLSSNSSNGVKTIVGDPMSLPVNRSKLMQRFRKQIASSCPDGEDDVGGGGVADRVKLSNKKKKGMSATLYHQVAAKVENKKVKEKKSGSVQERPSFKRADSFARADSEQRRRSKKFHDPSPNHLGLQGHSPSLNTTTDFETDGTVIRDTATVGGESPGLLSRLERQTTDMRSSNLDSEPSRDGRSAFNTSANFRSTTDQFNKNSRQGSRFTLSGIPKPEVSDSQKSTARGKKRKITIRDLQKIAHR